MKLKENTVKKNLKMLALGALLLLSAGTARAYQANLVNGTVSANTTAEVDLAELGLGLLSAQATYSTATIPAQTFGGGTPSTTSLTVASLAGLTTAYATNQITVVSTTGLTNATIVIPGYVLRRGFDWQVGATKAITAANIAAALNNNAPWQHAGATGAIVYSTATSWGTSSNAYTMTTSVPSLLTIANPTYTGGKNMAAFSLSGRTLTNGQQWYTGGSAALTATSIAAAINADAVLSGIMRAAAVGSVVTATSTLTGTSRNFTATSSTQAALTLAGPVTIVAGAASGAMTGGTNAAYALNSATIRITSHGFNTGLPLLYSIGTTNIGGLTAETTYYAIRLDANNIQLASSKANAVLGTGTTLTSTATLTTAPSWTLAPLAITGNTTIGWEGSNDGESWTNLSPGAPAITIAANAAASSYSWSNIPASYSLVRASVTAPTTGGMTILITAYGQTTGPATSVPAGGITNGPLASSILPSTVAYTSVAQTFTAAQTISGASIGASSSTSGGFTMKLKGAYTSTEASTLSAAVGEFIFNTTLGTICQSTAVAAALPAAWCLPMSTSTTANRIPCY